MEELGRCENCGKYVLESELISMITRSGEEQLWCTDCLE